MQICCTFAIIWQPQTHAMNNERLRNFTVRFLESLASFSSDFIFQLSNFVPELTGVAQIFSFTLFCLDLVIFL